MSAAVRARGLPSAPAARAPLNSSFRSWLPKSMLVPPDARPSSELRSEPWCRLRIGGDTRHQYDCPEELDP